MAFFTHSLAFQAPSIFSAARRVPLSSSFSAVSTASRCAPLLDTERLSRASQAASMAPQREEERSVMVKS